MRPAAYWFPFWLVMAGVVSLTAISDSSPQKQRIKSYSPPEAKPKNPNPSNDEDYDRLDGKGASGKRVDVIEWEGNLEIHVYPGNSLMSLALKLDPNKKGPQVLVIGYRFKDKPKEQLIRRAGLFAVRLREGFQAYLDPSTANEYDKVLVSNEKLNLKDKKLQLLVLEPEPTQLYPDEHPGNSAPLAQEPEPSGGSDRKPSSDTENETGPSEGTIRSYQW